MPDEIFYPISWAAGKQKGIQEATGVIQITAGITCTDDGEGNITITEGE